MAKITLTGNLFIQLTEGSKPSPLPLNIDFDYTEKSVVDYSWTTNQSNVALAMGSVTAPRFIFIEVTEGSVSLSTDIGGTGAVKFSANPIPAAGDPPATGILATFDAATVTWYVTTLAPARARIWFFE